MRAFWLLCLLVASAAQADMRLLGAHAPLSGLLPLDARPLDDCLRAGVQGSHCLPAGDFVSAAGELASFRDIFWAFGTAGLDADDPVLVFADDPRQRDALAALLFLAGQRQVLLWPGDADALRLRLGQASSDQVSGQPRGITRSHIYTGRMRHEWLALPDENPGTNHAEPITAASPLDALARFTAARLAGRTTIRLLLDRPDRSTSRALPFPRYGFHTQRENP